MHSDGHYLGKFNISSGVMRVTDPCYDPGTWCSGTIDVPNGEWHAYIEESDEGTWGKRVASIEVRYQNDFKHYSWELTNIDVGVDSGQAGFFDNQLYPDHPGDDPFYDRVCRLTLGENSAGVIEFGAVSSSGYGDGGYSCYVARNSDNQIVAAKIVFIDDGYEEDEEDY